jgi:molecular chaperone GrpE
MRPTDAQPDADSSESENVESLRKERDALILERDTLFDRLARATADFQNARRRLEADKDQSVAFANGALIKSLLPVIDNFERALAVDASTTDAGSILKGMQIVHDQWMTVLKNQFVEAIAPEPGTPFDPATMEALIHQPDDKLPPNSVTQLLQRGYALHGRTLRPAQVAVSKPK